MNPSFWNNKRVLLTGHTGFKGSWMSLWLQSAGARLTGVALAPPTTPSLFEVANVAAGMTSELADIRDMKAMHTIVAKHRPEIVIHMAAQSVVRESYQNPVDTYATNVMGTVHVLEAIRQVGGVKAVVVVSSDKCYDNKEWVWGYRETDALGGYDPYSNSKGCTELVTAAYRSSYFAAHDHDKHGVAVATARAGNVIGGGDWTADQLVPDTVRAFSEQRPVRLRSPGAVRPWQFVLEPIDGYLSLAEHLYMHGSAFADAWNFGPSADHAQPVQWIVEHLAKQWGESAKWEKDAQQHPHEAGFLKLDSSKAKAQLNWQSKLNLATALQWTVEWYRAYQLKNGMRALTLAQIDRFMRHGSE